MAHIDDMIKFKEEQEKILKNTISNLESQRASLDQLKEQNQQKIEDLNSKIVDAYSELSQVREEEEVLKDERKEERKRDIHENVIEPLKEVSEKMPEVAAGLAQIMDQSGQALVQQNSNDIAMREFTAQNQVVIEQQKDAHQAVATNPSQDTKSLQDIVKDEYSKIEDGLKEAYEMTGKTELPERVKTEVEVKWKNDIAEKQYKINETHEKQLKALNDNNAVLVIQKMDLKKFPNAEKRLEQLKPIERAMEKEYKNIEDKFKDGNEDILKEKIVFEKAVEKANSDRMEGVEREKAIHGQRVEFERQREIEKLRKLDR